ncbi:lyase [Lysobacter alkalisoli]|uniref:Virginiamycin B lyase n=2 Tax=Marilutibacter alkalisoli TaxID=2591633 RepID=A0A514BWJ5_9GAMM|nr:lyase [Lysobacter alkalisoli]
MLAQASLVAGEVTTQAYQVSKGARAHDVAADPAADGPVWYTAQRQGALGKLDPKTGDWEHIPLGEGSAPHGVVVGPDGAPWVTDSGLNAIVRVDPRTHEVKTWPLPEERGYTNLNTLTFDGRGKVWFTGQNGIYGRVDPDSGEVTVREAPKGRGPYGIATTPSGEVYYASLAGSHIAHIDQDTGEATVIEPPTAGQGARRVWSDSQGRIWVSEWNSGQLSRFTPSADNPAAGEWKAWKLPGDDPKAYSVYVDETDKVWVTDFGANAVLRFDPESGRFESFPSDRENANVRQMLGRKGEAWAPESGTDRLIVFRYGSGE